MTNPPATVAHRFAAAFNATDVERLLACFDVDARYDDLFYGRVHGHPGIRTLFTRMYAEGDRHEWALGTVVSVPTCTIAEWAFTFTVSDRVPVGAGRSLRFPGVSIFETRDGLCHTYRERFDRAAVLLALGTPPARVGSLVRRRSTVEVLAGGG